MNYYITPFKYEEIYQNEDQVQIREKCSAMSFNNDSTILTVGLENGFIQLYAFKYGKLKLITQFNRKSIMQRFIIMTKSKQYFSQNMNYNLTASSLIGINNHKTLSQTINFNANIILFNQQEDLMITGNYKGNISFIQKQMLSWNIIDTIKVSQQLLQLSLNYSENQLIAKIRVGKILILQKIIKDCKENWIIFQQIQFQEMLNQMLFINDQLIAIQILGSRNWKLYKMGKNQTEYTFKSTIQIPGMNQDLYYILKKLYLPELDISNPNINFFKLRFGIGKLYLAIEYNKEFNPKLKIDCFDSFNTTGEYVSYFDSTSKQIKIAQHKQLQWEYKLIKRQIMQEEDPLQIIAINIDSLILIGSINKSIKIYSLQNLIFNQIQQLDDHLDLVHCLQFYKKNNQFVSGSQDKTLRIWKWDMNSQQYICQQILKGFVEFQYVCINIDEDLMISGGQNQISFWRFQDLYWSNQQNLIFDNDHIQGLSLSPSQQRVITCSINKKIIIIQQQKKYNQTIWQVQNEINVDIQGYALFINNDNLIAFQSINESQITIYSLESEENKIQCKTQLIVNEDNDISSNQYPFIYNQNKNIFLVQINSSIYIITISDNQQLSLYQKFQDSYIDAQGALSMDGQLYISWNYKEKEVYIRQFQCY